MRFQLFGYRFDLTSEIPVPEAKAMIQDGKANWFDPDQTVRGVVIGPFFMLQLGRFFRYSPLVLGWIWPAGSGCRIAGRVGFTISDLVYFGAILPVWALFLYGAAIQFGHYGQIAALALASVGVVLLILWNGFSRGRHPRKWPFPEKCFRFLHGNSEAFRD